MKLAELPRRWGIADHLMQGLQHCAVHEATVVHCRGFFFLNFLALASHACPFLRFRLYGKAWEAICQDKRVQIEGKAQAGRQEGREGRQAGR